MYVCVYKHAHVCICGVCVFMYVCGVSVCFYYVWGLCVA